MSGLPNNNQNNDGILNDIQSLQQMEQQLFNTLETNPNLSTEEQKEIIKKINQLSNMRTNLYQTLSGISDYFKNALNTSVGSLREQAIAIKIVENELNRSKKRLALLEEEKNNKIRLVEINTYYGDRYAAHSQLMKIVIFTLIPVIILAFIHSKGFLPDTIYYILLCIVAIIGAYFFWIQISSMIMRDNMNYQEYAWSFDPNSMSTGSPSHDDPWGSLSGYGTCIGQRCCSTGLVYDDNLDQCVTANKGVASSKKEKFVTGVLTKLQPGNYKISYDLNDPEPFNQ